MKRNKYIFFLILLFPFNYDLFSQNDEIIIKEVIIEDGDTLLSTDIPSVDILTFKDPKERLRYYKLKRRVIKVYPYAIYTKNKLNLVDNKPHF